MSIDHANARPGRRAWVCASVTVTAVVLCTTIALPAKADAFTPHHAVTRQASGKAHAEAFAAQQAADTNEPVAVDADTTAYSTTQAMPDGSLQTEFTADAERTQNAAGQWVDLDASLSANSDGTFSPVASTNSLVLSGGGTGPLAVMHDDGARLALTWPGGPLPTPTVDGAEALYAEVLPDVDLQVTAKQDGGMSELLVVKSAEAAASPALAALRLKTSLTGATMTEDGADNLSAVTADGTVVFHAGTPMMWDSSTDVAVVTPAAETPSRARTSSTESTDGDLAVDASRGPADGAAQVAVGVTVSSDAITLTPSQDLLTDPDTTYPVYIDPDWVPGSGSLTGWDWTQAANPNTSWWKTNSNGEPAVGYQGWQLDNAPGKNASYWQFSIGTLGTGSNFIHSATFQAIETDTGYFSCTDTRAIILKNYSTHISSATTWNNPPGASGSVVQLDSQEVAGASNANGCPNRTVQWDTTNSITSDGDGTVTYGLLPYDATDKNYYRRFSGSTATLSINYDRAPKTPTNLSVTPTPRNPSGSCTSAEGWIGSTGTIAMNAKIDDPDFGVIAQHVQGRFHLWDFVDGATPIIDPSTTAGQSAYQTSAGQTSVTVPRSLLKNGHEYGWSVYGWDQYTAGPISDHCYFRLDTTRPTAAAALSGTARVGTATTVHITATDPAPTGGSASGINHYDYSLSSADDLDSDGGTHTTGSSFTFTPQLWGTNYVYVAAVDNAGNQSATYTLKIYVADTPNPNPTPGDITGDHIPDLLAVNGTTGDLQLFTTEPTSAYSSTPTLAADKTDAPNQQSWTGALVAHRSSTLQSSSGTTLDDMWAVQGSLLRYYPNQFDNAADASHPYVWGGSSHDVSRPLCDSDYTNCSTYNSADWSSVHQMIAPGDVDGDGIPDLITEETGNLWLFHGSTSSGNFIDPYLLSTQATSSPVTTWAKWRLIAPGDATGPETVDHCVPDGQGGLTHTTSAISVPDIWAMSADADGGILQRQITVANYGCNPGGYEGRLSAGVAESLGAVHETASTGWGTDDRPLTASPGDINSDGIPDLFSVVRTSTSPLQYQLWENDGTTLSTDNPHVAGHKIADDGVVINWRQFTDIS